MRYYLPNISVEMTSVLKFGVKTSANFWQFGQEKIRQEKNLTEII